MAIECMVWVLEQQGTLATSEKFVLLGIANHSHPGGEGAFPSLDTLARYTLLSKSTVQRAIKELILKGYLEKESGGGRRSNTYKILMNYAEVVELKLVGGDEAGQDEHGRSDHPAVSPGPSTLPAVTREPGQALTKEPLYTRNKTEIEPRAKKTDEVWDAVMEACGVNTATINSNERGRYNKAVKLLKESAATAEEIHTRAKVYRRKFKGAAITPVAVANHWSELDPNTVPIEDVVTAPKGWSAIQQAREERNERPRT